MIRRPDILQQIRPNRILITCHLLLLKPPVGILDLVREQITSCQCMPQPKNRPQRARSLSRLVVPLVSALDLHEPGVVGVASEAAFVVHRNFVLEINVRNGRAVVERVEAPVSGDVLELYA